MQIVFFLKCLYYLYYCRILSGHLKVDWIHDMFARLSSTLGICHSQTVMLAVSGFFCVYCLL